MAPVVQKIGLFYDYPGLQIDFLSVKAKKIQARPTYGLPTVNEESNPSSSSSTVQKCSKNPAIYGVLPLFFTPHLFATGSCG